MNATYVCTENPLKFRVSNSQRQEIDGEVGERCGGKSMFPDVRITPKVNVLWDGQNSFLFSRNQMDCPSNCLFTCVNKGARRQFAEIETRSDRVLTVAAERHHED